MTIAEIRELFSEDTEFYLAVMDFDRWDEIEEFRFKVNDVLFGTSAFAEMKVNRMRVDAKNKVIIESDMPMLIFNAWKKWGDV